MVKRNVASFLRGGGLCRPFVVGSTLTRICSRENCTENWQATVSVISQTKHGSKRSALMRMLVLSSVLEHINLHHSIRQFVQNKFRQGPWMHCTIRTPQSYATVTLSDVERLATTLKRSLYGMLATALQQLREYCQLKSKHVSMRVSDNKRTNERTNEPVSMSFFNLLRLPDAAALSNASPRSCDVGRLVAVCTDMERAAVIFICRCATQQSAALSHITTMLNY